MSVKTIYQCDKCGGEQFSEDQFWTVGVWAICSPVRVNPHYSEYVQNKKIQVCRPCLESLGIHLTVKDGGDSAPPAPTVEELIREIIERAQT